MHVKIQRLPPTKNVDPKAAIFEWFYDHIGTQIISKRNQFISYDGSSTFSQNLVRFGSQTAEILYRFTYPFGMQMRSKIYRYQSASVKSTLLCNHSFSYLLTERYTPRLAINDRLYSRYRRRPGTPFPPEQRRPPVRTSLPLSDRSEQIKVRLETRDSFA